MAALPFINWRGTGSIKTLCNCRTDLFHCAVLDSSIRYIHTGQKVRNEWVLNLFIEWNRECYVNSPVPAVACMQKWGLWLLLRWGGSNCTSHCAAQSAAICTIHHQYFCTCCLMGTFKTAAIHHRHERYRKFIFWVCSVRFVLYLFIGFVSLLFSYHIFTGFFYVSIFKFNFFLQEINHSVFWSQPGKSDNDIYIQYWLDSIADTVNWNLMLHQF